MVHAIGFSTERQHSCCPSPGPFPLGYCPSVYVKRQWPQGQHDLDSFSLLIWATMSLGDEHEGGQCGFGHEHLHWLVGEPCCESAL